MARVSSAIDPGERPHAQVGTSASQDYNSEAQHLLEKVRRIASDRNEEVVRFTGQAIGQLPQRPFTSLEALKNAVFQVLIERLRFHGISVKKQKMKHFNWCLPTSLDQETEWRLLLEDPLAVTPDMLATLMALKPSTADDDVPPKDTNVFYVRTFTMRVRDMRRVLQGMLHDGHDTNPRIFSWQERISGANDNDYFALRYVGQTKNSPWDRHRSDAYSRSLQSFMGCFYRQVGMDCPEVLASATVYIFEGATAHGVLDSDVLNRREQMLIVLTGDGSLNTEVGGKDIIILTDRDHFLFNSLRTDTVALMQQVSECSDSTREAISAYTKDVREYAKAHSTTRQGHKKLHVFSKKVQTMIEQQGTPRQLSDGSAVMVSLGSDIGDTHEEDEQPFFEAGGRSADALTLIYNHFGHWEREALPVPGGSVNPILTKRMARSGALPFADVFPWPVKHKDDYVEAVRLTGQYMKVTSPMIVVPYGGIPTYAAMQNFEPFTLNQYEKTKKADQRKNGEGHWVRNIMGVPRIAAFHGGAGPIVGKEFVVIPSCHPGLIGHVGIVKDMLARLLVLISGLGWRAMTVAVQLDLKEPSLTRREKCENILADLQGHLSEETDFGRAFALAKEKYIVATAAWHQQKWAHQYDIDVAKPPRRILPAKTSRVRKAQIDRKSVTTEAVSESFEVQIDEHSYQGADGADSTRYHLTWTEEDGQQWSIAPVILPKNAAPASSTDKRYLCYTSGGLDIRGSVGLSLGDRKPLLFGACKLETLPISSLVLTLSEQAGASLFFAHWEYITGLEVNEALVESLPPDCTAVPSASGNTANEPYYPEEFFTQSRSKRALPFAAVSLRKHGYSFYLSQIKRHLPANPGDLLWLVDRFFRTYFANGGEVDLISASLYNASVYRLIARFCAKPMYKKHPHLTTFLAFASMAEMGQDERNASSNALTMACEVLRDSTKKKSKTTNFPNKQTASRYVITLAGGENLPRNVIRDVDEPELERDIEILDEFYGDEADLDQDAGATAGGDDAEILDAHVQRDCDSNDESRKPAAKPSKIKGKGKKSQKSATDQTADHPPAATYKKRHRDDDSDDDCGAGSSKGAAKTVRSFSKIYRTKAI